MSYTSIVSNSRPRPAVPSKIDRLPPSAKLVYKVLESGGSLTQKDIVRATYLPPRTVRYALDRLLTEEVINERFCFRDARQSLYGLNASPRAAMQ